MRGVNEGRRYFGVIFANNSKNYDKINFNDIRDKDIIIIHPAKEKA
jgi:hypothetical protein